MLRQQRILVVDDEPAIRLRAQALLDKDYRLAFAQDGEEALAKVPEFKPDIILLDVDMPKLNGLETCRQLRQDQEYRFIKIIFVSGNLDLEDRLAGYRAGADDYIGKPYEADELVAKIRIMLRLEHLERINGMKSHFMALISHETRTPLNGILGFSKLLDARVPEEYRRMTAMIVESGQRLWEFIQKATLLCNVKSETQLQLTPLPVRTPLTAALTELDDKIAAKNLGANLAATADVTIAGNMALLTKAFNYIIDNAINFSNPNDTITIDVSARQDDQYVVTVADQGRGIAPDRLEQIFDEFAITDLAHHHRGQGLSLAIARQIFQLHGGNVTADNGQHGGAVFTITLPALV